MKMEMCTDIHVHVCAHTLETSQHVRLALSGTSGQVAEVFSLDYKKIPKEILREKKKNLLK